MKNFVIKQLFRISIFPLGFLAIAWIVFLLDQNYDLNLAQWGTSPRTAKGLSGILFSPFLHGSLEHIASNSIPVLVLGMMTFYFYRPLAWPVFFWMYIISGIWLWIGGRNSPEGDIHHIGASGMIYAAATFLFFSGVFRRHKQLMVVSALVLFLYGSMMWGIFPLMPDVSWEAHLFGALSGILVAFNYRKEGPQRKMYEWENEEEEDAPETYSSTAASPININYNYVSKTEAQFYNKRELINYLIARLRTLALRHELTEFDSGAFMLDIWKDNELHVIQGTDQYLGISKVTEETPPFTTAPDKSYTNTEEFIHDFEEVIR